MFLSNEITKKKSPSQFYLEPFMEAKFFNVIHIFLEHLIYAFNSWNYLFKRRYAGSRMH